MVTVLREAGLRFVIFTDDHEPAHVHVYGDGSAEIDLVGRSGAPALMHADGFKGGDVRESDADRCRAKRYPARTLEGVARLS